MQFDIFGIKIGTKDAVYEERQYKYKLHMDNVCRQFNLRGKVIKVFYNEQSNELQVITKE